MLLEEKQLLKLLCRPMRQIRKVRQTIASLISINDIPYH
jgi:hypothetical protein